MKVVLLRGGTYEQRAAYADEWLKGGARRVCADLKRVARMLHPGLEMQVDRVTVAACTSAMLTALGAGFDVVVVPDIEYRQRDRYMSYRARKAGAEVVVHEL